MPIGLLNHYKRLRVQITRVVGLRYFKVSVGILVTLATMFFLGYALYANWHQLRQYDWQINYSYLLMVFLCYPISLLFLMISWHWLIIRMGGPTSFRENIRIYCYSNLPKRIPGAIWYVVGRAHLYQAKGVSYSSTILATLSETLYLIFSGILLCLILLPFSFLPKTFGSLRVGWILLIALFAFLMLNPRFFNKALKAIQKRFNSTGQAQFSQKDTLVVAAGHSAAWISGGIILFLLANGVSSVPVNYLPAIILIWAISGVASLGTTFVLNGMGVKEVTLALLLSNYVALPVAVVISILFRIVIMIGEVFWSLVFIGLLAIPGIFHRKSERESETLM